MVYRTCLVTFHDMARCAKPFRERFAVIGIGRE
jgi:hypothetical protein